MKIEEFESLVDRHGEDLTQWPAALRQPATLLLRDSEEARDIVDQAKRLRTLLGGKPNEQAPAWLADRILAQAASLDGSVPETTRTSLRPRVSGTALMLPACFAIGVTWGLLVPHGADAGVRLDLPTFFAEALR